MFSFLPENFAKNFHNSCFAEHLSVPPPPESATVMCSVPVLESVLEYLYHYLQQTPTDVFLWILQNFSEEHMRMVASESPSLITIGKLTR